MTAAKILIVEDEFIIGEHLRSLLTGMDHTVSGLVGTGEEAVTHVAERRPDLVLLDIGLSGRMDGFEAAHKIRHDYGVAVVFMTGSTDPKTIDRMTAMNLDYVTKPFDAESIQAAVETALRD
jgi:DNA-binding response OmpR family regulator